MDRKTKCNIVQRLFNLGQGTWAEAVQNLYEDYNKLLVVNQQLRNRLGTEEL
jgi:hypothetical protein